MKRLTEQLWNDANGFIVSAELVTVATLLVLGLIVGMTSVQSTVVQEYQDIGTAIGALDQSYYYSGMRSSFTRCGVGAAGHLFGGCGVNAGCPFKAMTSGSAFFDRRHCEGMGDMVGCRGCNLEQGVSDDYCVTNPDEPTPELLCPSLPRIQLSCPDRRRDLEPGCRDRCSEICPRFPLICPPPPQSNPINPSAPQVPPSYAPAP